ncbi:MAG: hypothetical protein L3K17_05545 [Thermoplasmata archaeon]|nr:hypothetical protein [Thermoplasmata archaeon]
MLFVLAAGAFALLSTGAAMGPTHAGPSTTGFSTILPSSPTPLATALNASATPDLTLDTTVAPQAMCAQLVTACPAGVGQSRVQLTAAATGGPTVSWPAVQVAFVMETTSYDGDYGTDSAGLDPCADTGVAMAPVCEESNAIPFFVANGGAIAEGIQAANPHSVVSFAMVDYYDAWSEPWDDEDGPEYHVDLGSFVPSGDFGYEVHATFQQQILAGGWYSWDQDMDNNFLDASQITALYGAITGSQLDWAPNAHHVIVWIGSSAPRDPHYPENYCVSASAWNTWGTPSSGCLSETCEPSYTFPGGNTPSCEGWVASQNGNPADSIAALAHTAPSCTDSIGGVCTVDTVDVWTTSTDPYSYGWPSQFAKIGGGPGGPQVIENVAKVLEAGCDMAQATGGTWAGPAFATCPDGQPGSLQYVNHGPIDKPDTFNPTLLYALTQIGFGPVEDTEIAHATNAPLFVYVPIGNIAVAPAPDWTAACQTPTGFARGCQMTPTILKLDGVTAYGWNWSDTSVAANGMFVGDVWTASFNIMATGPPYADVPVDACVTTTCYAEGSGAVGQFYTWANYLENQNKTAVLQSFPAALVHVESVTPSALGPVVPAAPPPVPPGLPIPAPTAVPVTTPLLIVIQTGSTLFSVNAASAGLLAAGFMRVTMRNKPIAVAVAAKSSKAPSRFDGIPSHDSRFGRFE